MKRLGLVLVLALARPAAAAPVEGRVVVSAFPLVGDSFSANLGLEGEIGPREGFFSVGATAWTLGVPQGPLRGDYSATAFARARVALTAQDELGALVGQNFQHKRVDACGNVCAPPDSTWLVLGLAWHHQTDRYWLRLTPQYALTWDPRFVGAAPSGFVGGWVSEALPWVEAGLWLTPGLGIGARFGPGIAQAVWRF
jgi:hypothetical protein